MHEESGVVLLWNRRISCPVTGYGRERSLCSGRPAEGLSFFLDTNSRAFGIASVRRAPLPAFPSMSPVSTVLRFQSIISRPIPIHYQSDLPRHPWRGIARFPAVRPCIRRRPTYARAPAPSGLAYAFSIRGLRARECNKSPPNLQQALGLIACHKAKVRQCCSRLWAYSRLKSKSPQILQRAMGVWQDSRQKFASPATGLGPIAFHKAKVRQCCSRLWAHGKLQSKSPPILRRLWAYSKIQDKSPLI